MQYIRRELIHCNKLLIKFRNLLAIHGMLRASCPEFSTRRPNRVLNEDGEPLLTMNAIAVEWGEFGGQIFHCLADC